MTAGCVLRALPSLEVSPVFLATTVAGSGCGNVFVIAACGSWSPQLEPLLWSSDAALQDALDQCDVVVNTTPVGMASPTDPSAALASPLSDSLVNRLKPGSWVYDIIYTPRPTQLLKLAEAQGCRTLDGLEMLVQQGAAALRLWTGQDDVPVAAMREAALQRLAA